MMATQDKYTTRLTMTARDGWFRLHLRIRTRWLWALLAALAAATGSPALLAFLQRLGN
ncbi:MAG TPA: hypothetical protein PLH19_16105 [Anaerolineae bacterium]|nr:hypothetical protein [Anaerolineae bacterium]HQH40037.1 hypothetical protein [Anaerolineae bacterium]